MNAHLTAAPDAGPVDLRHLDGMLTAIQQTERDLSAMAAYLTEAREVVSARPDDPEAARRVTMTELRMRGDALALAQNFAALARPDGAAP